MSDSEIQKISDSVYGEKQGAVARANDDAITELEGGGQAEIAVSGRGAFAALVVQISRDNRPCYFYLHDPLALQAKS